MNKKIIGNLYEFWSYIGLKTDRLNETLEYKAVSMINSDWPNRIFSISNKPDILKEVISLSQKDLWPNILTIPKPNFVENYATVELKFRQKNMALDLQKMNDSYKDFENITQVKTQEDAVRFANTASLAFGYRVDSNTVFLINQDPSKIKIFIYTENNECLGCGIVFFDSSNNAGFHMIGTIPKGRGKGIGKKITEKLLTVAKSKGYNNCVLHASKMGESIYKKLGFIAYGELETYKILKTQAKD